MTAVGKLKAWDLCSAVSVHQAVYAIFAFAGGKPTHCQAVLDRCSEKAKLGVEMSAQKGACCFSMNRAIWCLPMFAELLVHGPSTSSSSVGAQVSGAKTGCACRERRKASVQSLRR